MAATFSLFFALDPVILELADRSQVLLAISLAMVFLVPLEISYRRDFVTPTHLVRQYGFLGWKQVRVPLTAIERVEFTLYKKSFNKEFRTGDIEVHVPGDRLQFLSIPSAAEMAQRILDRKQRALERAATVSRRTDPEAHLPPPS